jgi:TfoX/Sxy family transcriptional regulator of competence genes
MLVTHGGMSIPKPDPESKAYFETLVPDDPRVGVRPMFGNVSAFVNGNMFMGLYGSDVFLRLPGADRGTLAKAGGGPFEPMPGRAMSEYMIIPTKWRRQPKTLQRWVTRSLEFAAQLPPKEKRQKSKRKRP